MPRTALKTAPVWLSERDARDLVEAARKAQDRHSGIISGIDAKVARQREFLNKNLAAMDAASRLRALDAAVSKVKGELKAASNAERSTIIRETAAMAARATAGRQFWSSGVHVLLRETIASAKRATIFENLAAAGPQELASFASLAVAAADKDMGAAVVARLHVFPNAASRPVSPAYVADALVGEIQAEILQGLLEVERIAAEIQLADRMFEQGRSGSSGIQSIKVALMKRRYAGIGEQASSEAGEAEIGPEA